MVNGIWTIQNKEEEKLLRKKTLPFDFAKYSKAEIRELIDQMRRAMRDANGIGLSANQIGLNINVFVGQVPIGREKSKFYAIFNAEPERTGKEKSISEEGCLSVPGIYGHVERPEQITIVGQDRNGKQVKIKAWGLLGRMFQHEMDHLQGALFIDKAKDLNESPASERLKKKHD